MDDKLLKKYLAYASTDEGYAVLFVKKNLPRSKGHWVDIIDCERYEMSDDNLHFKFVTGGLYKRIFQPQYPPKSEYTFNGKFDEHRYYLVGPAKFKLPLQQGWRPSGPHPRGVEHSDEAKQAHPHQQHRAQ